MTKIPHIPTVDDVLREFVYDVEATCSHIPEFTTNDLADALDWPDLMSTYEKAKRALARSKGDQR